MCSAAAIVLPVGALTTVIPAAGRGVEVDVVDADAGPADDLEPVAGGDHAGVDLDLAADDQRVVVGQDRAELVRATGPGARRRRAARGGGRRPPRRWVRRRGSSRRDAGPGLDRASPAPTPSASAAAANAAPTRGPGRDPAALLEADASRGRRSRRGSPRPSPSPRWPSRKILPVSLPWPPARTTPWALIAPLNVFQSWPSGSFAAVTVRDANRSSANSSKPSAWRPARDAAAHASWRAKTPAAPFGLHQADALVDLVDDGDRRRERRLAVRGRVAVRAEVEVEARHLRRAPSRPSRAARPRSSPGPGAAIHAFCEPVTTTSTPQASISNGTAPRPETLSTRISASGLTSRIAAARTGDRVHHAGRRLVVGQQDRLVRRVRGERLADGAGIGRLAPLDVELRHVRAVDPGDLREPVAERADRDAEDAVAGRQRVDDRGLEPAAAGASSASRRRWSSRRTASSRSRIRSSIAANSGPRWLIIWRAPAWRTDGGRAVGPGIRRLGSKRSTGSTLLCGWRP